MSQLKVYDDSKNYTCQAIKLPVKRLVKGLDNLVEVVVQGNSCLVGKESPEDILYLFFPSECQIDESFLKANNLFRHSYLNENPEQSGFFDDSGRVKAIKFKGIISSGFVIPVSSLGYITSEYLDLNVGDEFNMLNSKNICKKYIKQKERNIGMSGVKKTRIIDSLVNSKLAPEHMDTSHLLKNVHKINYDDEIIVTYKLHGTSARYFHTLVKRKLNMAERSIKWIFRNFFTRLQAMFGEVKILDEDYDYLSASRRVIVSVGFETLPNKNHYYTEDLWSKVGKNVFAGKLNKGEAVYCEIIGKTYDGGAIQSGYTYGFETPKVHIYRISNINPQGIEIDLSYDQMVQRSMQLGVDSCPLFYKGTLRAFIEKYTQEECSKDDREKEPLLEKIFYKTLLEKDSIFDKNVIEEGFCIRVDKYPKPDIFKIKSRLFLLHEGAIKDKDIADMEEEQTV